MNKIIHQIWLQGESLCPDHYKSWKKKWQSIHGGFEYIFWDEKRISKFLEKHFNEYFNEWYNLDLPIKKCDSARYFILYHYGGIYADLDTIPFKPITQLIDDLALTDYDVILSEESSDPQAWKSKIAFEMAKANNFRKVLGNAIIISKKHATFLIDFVKEGFKVSHMPVLESFSTWHMSKFYQINKHKYNMVVLPPNHLLLTKYTDENTYAIHKYEATWFDNSKDRPWDI